MDNGKLDPPVSTESDRIQHKVYSDTTRHPQADYYATNSQPHDAKRELEMLAAMRHLPAHSSYSSQYLPSAQLTRNSSELSSEAQKSALQRHSEMLEGIERTRYVDYGQLPSPHTILDNRDSAMMSQQEAAKRDMYLTSVANFPNYGHLSRTNTLPSVSTDSRSKSIQSQQPTSKRDLGLVPEYAQFSSTSQFLPSLHSTQSKTSLDGQPSKLSPTAELDMTMSVLEWAQRVGYSHLLSPSQYLPAKPVSHEIPKDSVGQSDTDLTRQAADLSSRATYDQLISSLYSGPSSDEKISKFSEKKQSDMSSRTPDWLTRGQQFPSTQSTSSHSLDEKIKKLHEKRQLELGITSSWLSQQPLAANSTPSNPSSVEQDKEKALKSELSATGKFSDWSNYNQSKLDNNTTHTSTGDVGHTKLPVTHELEMSGKLSDLSHYNQLIANAYTTRSSTMTADQLSRNYELDVAGKMSEWVQHGEHLPSVYSIDDRLKILSGKTESSLGGITPHTGQFLNAANLQSGPPTSGDQATDISEKSMFDMVRKMSDWSRHSQVSQTAQTAHANLHLDHHMPLHEQMIPTAHSTSNEQAKDLSSKFADWTHGHRLLSPQAHASLARESVPSADDQVKDLSGKSVPNTRERLSEWPERSSEKQPTHSGSNNLLEESLSKITSAVTEKVTNWSQYSSYGHFLPDTQPNEVNVSSKDKTSTQNTTSTVHTGFSEGVQTSEVPRGLETLGRVSAQSVGYGHPQSTGITTGETASDNQTAKIERPDSPFSELKTEQGITGKTTPDLGSHSSHSESKPAEPLADTDMVRHHPVVEPSKPASPNRSQVQEMTSDKQSEHKVSAMEPYLYTRIKTEPVESEDDWNQNASNKADTPNNETAMGDMNDSHEDDSDAHTDDADTDNSDEDNSDASAETIIVKRERGSSEEYEAMSDMSEEENNESDMEATDSSEDTQGEKGAQKKEKHNMAGSGNKRKNKPNKKYFSSSGQGSPILHQSLKEMMKVYGLKDKRGTQSSKDSKETQNEEAANEPNSSVQANVQTSATENGSLKRKVSTPPCPAEMAKYAAKRKSKSGKKPRPCVIRDSIMRPWECNECQKAFTTKSNLKCHKRIHTGEKPFQCGICNYAFRESSSLTKHYRTHTGEKTYRCPHDECGRMFASSSILSNHVRIHTGEKPYACAECGESFGQRTSLIRHKVTHLDEKPELCGSCGKRFLTRAELKRHLRTHSDEKPCKCDQCDAAFKVMAHLKRHQTIHTGEKPFHCDVCDKAFTNKGSIKTHMLQHSGVKPYECETCGSKFYQRIHLIKHYRVHTGERPYMCDVCGRAFGESQNLRRHTKTHLPKAETKPDNKESPQKSQNSTAVSQEHESEIQEQTSTWHEHMPGQPEISQERLPI